METFQQIIDGEKPVLVDFFATWCGPCKTLSPLVAEIGKEIQGKARVLKIDVDKNQTLAAQYQIQSVPTLLIYKKGKVVWKKVGGTNKMEIIQAINSFL